MYYVTKTFRFAYAHHLPSHEGLCKNIHGHNAKVEITLEQPNLYASGPQTGMVEDFGNIKKVMNPIIKELDHSFLNDNHFFSCNAPTAENMCFYITKRIQETKLGAKLYSVRVWETDDSFAEYKEDNRFGNF